MTDAAPARPLPEVSSWTQAFWDSIRIHQLAIQHCADCDRWIHPPLPLCPSCANAVLEYRPVSGLGTVSAFTVVHRPPTAAFTPPYVVALVALDDASVDVLSNVVVDDVGEVREGMPVRTVFEDVTDNFSLFMFTPTGTSA